MHQKEKMKNLQISSLPSKLWCKISWPLMASLTNCQRSSEVHSDARSKKLILVSLWLMEVISFLLTLLQKAISNSEKQIPVLELPIYKILWSKSINGLLKSQNQTISRHSTASKWKWSSLKWTSKKISELKWKNTQLIYTEMIKWKPLCKISLENKNKPKLKIS